MERLLEQQNSENRKPSVMKMKYKKKIRRGCKKKNDLNLCIFSTNAAQLKGKINSFKSEIKRINAGIFTIQETHYATKGKIQIENYEVFEAIRKKVKGGTAVGVHKALKPVLICEYDE